MHIISHAAVAAQGSGIDTFATIFVAFSISSIIVGISFYLLGYFKVGNVVLFIPKHVIVGCIGGIGIFIFKTGIEVSTNRTVTTASIKDLFFSTSTVPLWLVPACFECILRVINLVVEAPLLSPFYFASIPAIFYMILLAFRIPIENAHAGGEDNLNIIFALLYLTIKNFYQNILLF